MDGGTPIERFWKRVAKSDGGCWDWLGTKNYKGYGIHVSGGKESFRYFAHRFSYELHVGPIPNGLTLDHLCRNRACVNPAHLEAVTNRVNVLRGTGPTAMNAKKTHCKRGHPFDAANTLFKRTGRTCRQCATDYRRARQAANIPVATSTEVGLQQAPGAVQIGVPMS